MIQKANQTPQMIQNIPYLPIQNNIRVRTRQIFIRVRGQLELVIHLHAGRLKVIVICDKYILDIIYLQCRALIKTNIRKTCHLNWLELK